MMMDGTQWEACSNQQDLFPAVEEVAAERMEKGWLTVEERVGVCVSVWEVACISQSIEHVSNRTENSR